MSYAPVSYTGDGVTTNYTVTFPYISEDEVVVTVDGASASFSFLSESVIQFSEAPTDGAIIYIERDTSDDTQAIVWNNAVSLTAGQLNTAIKQLFYMTQEAKANAKENSRYSLFGAMYTADSIDDQLDGTKTDFILTHYENPFVSLTLQPGHWFVSVNGLTQYEGEAFTISRTPTATTIKFSFAPTVGDNIQISYLRLMVGSSDSTDGSSSGGSTGGAVTTVASLDEILEPFEGQLVYSVADGALYIFQNGKWVSLDSILTPNAPPVVPTLDDLEGTAAEGTIGAFEGKLYVYQNDEWNRVVEEITAAAIQSGLYSYGLRPMEYYEGLPVEGNIEGRVVFDTSTKTMNMFIDGAWKNFADIYTPDAPTGVELTDADPTTGNYEGRTILNTTLAQLRVYKSGTWEPAVLTTQISDDSITTAMIQADAITAGKIQAGAVGVSELAASAVSTDKLAANSVTGAKIQGGTITGDKIAAQEITGTHIQGGSISTSHLAADFVVAAQVSANSIGTAELKSNAVTTDKLASGQIVTGHLQASSITTDKIVGGAVSAMASSTGATKYASAGTWTTLATVTLSCTAGAKRVINVGTAIADENSSGSANNDVAEMQGMYQITANGSVIQSFDGIGLNGSTTLHAYHAGDPTSRSGSVTFALMGYVANFSGATRPGARFRTPTITVTELKK